MAYNYQGQYVAPTQQMASMSYGNWGPANQYTNALQSATGMQPGGIQPSFNYNSAGQVVSAGMPGMPSTGGSGVYGAYGAGSGGGAPSSLQDVFNMQRNENMDKRNYNRGLWAEVRDYTKAVPQQYANNPLTQGAQSQAQRLVNDPEAINDRTQQLAVNRASNLLNAAQNMRRGGLQRDLAARGMLGGSTQRAATDKLERERGAALTGLGSDLEVQRAIRRNQDITGAVGLASGLAGQQAGIGADAARTLMSGVPYEAPDDFSGLAAALGVGGGMAGGFRSSGMGYSGLGGSNYNLPQMGARFVDQREGPFVSQYGTYNDNYRPRTGGGFGAGQSVYSDQYGRAYGTGQMYGNEATGGPLDTGNYNPVNTGGSGSLYNRQTGWNQYGTDGTLADILQGTYLGSGITQY